MFLDLEFLDRFDATAACGFKAVEFLFPYDHPPETIAARLDKNGLVLALFNTPAGDWNRGPRGLSAPPRREQGFRAGGDTPIRYARAAPCPLIHTIAGLAP